jgi:hypothetical protein
MASLFAVGGACSSFSSGDTTSSLDAGEGGAADAPDEKSDEASSDATSAPDVTPQGDGSSDAENLFANGDFELGCIGWSGSYSSFTDDSVAHSPSKSCRVCATATVTFTIGKSVPRPILPGETYIAEAYVHAASAAGTPTSALRVVLNVYNGAVLAKTTTATGAIPGSTWTKIGGLIDVGGDGGTQLDVSFESGDPGDGGNCYLIDDARLYRQ